MKASDGSYRLICLRTADRYWRTGQWMQILDASASHKCTLVWTKNRWETNRYEIRDTLTHDTVCTVHSIHRHHHTDYNNNNIASCIDNEDNKNDLFFRFSGENFSIWPTEFGIVRNRVVHMPDKLNKEKVRMAKDLCCTSSNRKQ